MTAARVLAVIVWAAIFVAAAGAICMRPEVMAYGGIVAAIAATVWGLLKSLDEQRARHWETARSDSWARNRAADHRPTWDTEIWGAVE